MYKNNKSFYLRRLERMGVICCLSALSIPAAGQAVKDSTLINFFGSEEEVSKWKGSQPNDYAFDHLLQKRPVAKFYKKKRFGDRFFLEGGMHAFANHSSNLNISLKNIQPWAYVGFGDWITPLHGWRVSFQGGKYKIDGNHSKIIGASLDYLISITALAAEEYDAPRRFEFFGVAGGDLFLSRLNGKNDYAWGAHFGLRGQANLNRYTYFFLEPRIGAYSNKLIHNKGWENYVLGSSLLTGFGYRLNPTVDYERIPYTPSGSFLDNTFISFAAGPSFLIKNDSHKFGGVGNIYIGKWINPYSAIRLGIGSAFRRQTEHNKLQAISASVGYMWNMHNTFGGYDPNRYFWINAVADINGNLSLIKESKDLSVSFGAGIQPNVRIANGVSLYLEPRLDYYNNQYMKSVAGKNSKDLAASLLAGIVFQQGTNTRTLLKKNDDFKSESWLDHLFIDLGAGALMPVTYSGKDHIMPTLYAGIGKWFNAISGLRLRGEVTKLEDLDSKRFGMLSYGVDYLWNLTNSFRGYDANRRFSLVASAGINGLSKVGKGKFYVGANTGIKGLVHLNQMTSIFIEPQLSFYGKNVYPVYTSHFRRMDMIGTLLAGIQFATNNYRSAENRPYFERHDENSFVSIAAGTGTSADAPKNGKNYGAVGRISLGHWYSPVSAWRISMSGTAKPKMPYRNLSLTAGIDYLADFTTLAYGYNPDRIICLRGIAGINIGADYTPRIHRQMRMMSDLHIGGQLAVSVGKRNELFAEPQVAYVIGGKPTTRSSQRLIGTAVLGINHKFKMTRPIQSSQVDQDQNDFVSVSVGTGAHSQTVTMGNVKSKLTFDFDIAYGHWYNSISGMRVGVSNTTTPLKKGFGHQNMTSIHADYLLNLIGLTSGKEVFNTNWVFNGIAGASLNFGKAEQMDNTFAPGIHLGLELGYKFTPKWELFAEPTGLIIGKKIWENNSRPMVIHPRLMIGTKYHF